MQGFAWRLLIPTHLHLRATINLLEFIASIITVHIALLKDTHNNNHPHVLGFTDSNSTVGWLYHSTFDPIKNKHHDNIARHFSKLLLKFNATLHPEHIPGRHNIFGDSLSRDFHLLNKQLTNLFTSLSPHPLLPQNFKIIPLPEEISSWILSLLESMTPSNQSPPKPTPSMTALSESSKTICKNATYLETLSSTASYPTKEPSSSPASPTASDETISDAQQEISSWEKQLAPPSATWFRPSGLTFGLIQPEMQQERKRRY